MHKFGVFLLAWLLGTGWALAQVTTGTISGVVQDETKAVLPGASIVVTNLEIGLSRELVTDSDGTYQAPNLGVGRYEVRASLGGFRAAVRSGIELTVGQGAVVNFTLRVGDVAEQIVVVGAVALVNTTNAAITGTVDQQTIRDVPLNARSIDQLVLLQVGTISARRDADPSALGGGSKLSISGARPQQNVFLLDGTDTNDSRNVMPGSAAGVTLGVDTIREFRVLTNSYGAEYGRAAGGVVTAVTRSGSNKFQGGAFAFHRNSAFDARNFFDRDPSNPAERSDPPPFKRYQFGSTLGGPIRQNRTFFFGSYEGLREDLTVTKTAVVPNALARQGIIPSGGRVGAPLVEVAVPAVVQPWLNLYPLPNGRDHGNGTGDLVFEAGRTVDQSYVSMRLDHVFSANHKIFGRYTLDPSTLENPQQLPFETAVVTARNQYVTVQFDSVLSSTVVNALRFGLNRSVTREDTVYTGMSESMTFVPGIPFEQGGELNVTGLPRIGFYLTPKAMRYTMPEVSNDLTLIRGRHTLKTGVLFKRIFDDQGSVNARAGRYQIRGGLFDLMRGANTVFSLEWPGTSQERAWRYNYVGFYVQDDFKIARNLTLNLGLREEFLTSPIETQGKCANVTDVMQTASTVGCPFFKTFKNNWAPRVGFAWDAKGDARFVLRGGAGIFYDQPFSTYWRAAGRFAPPFTIIYATAANHPFGAPLDLSTPPTSGFDVRTQKVTGTTYLAQYNVSVQSEVMPGTAVTVGYIGSQGRRLFRTGQMNTRPFEILPDGRKRYALTGPRINPVWGDVRLQQTDANSDYNALVASLNQRVGEYLRLQASYTFGKTMSDSETVFGLDFSGAEGSVMDPLDPHRDRALAGFHIGHTFSLTSSYDLPFRAEGSLGRLARGWQLSSIVTATSGVPFSASTTALVDGTTGGSPRRGPDLLPGAALNPVLGGPDRYFDDSGFVLPEPGIYGNLGRNTIIGPGLFTVDFLLAKNTALTKGTGLQVRAEFFNLFNHPNFSNPSGVIFDSRGVRDPLSGRITRTSTSARQIQFGLRLSF